MCLAGVESDDSLWSEDERNQQSLQAEKMRKELTELITSRIQYFFDQNWPVSMGAALALEMILTLRQTSTEAELNSNEKEHSIFLLQLVQDQKHRLDEKTRHMFDLIN